MWYYEYWFNPILKFISNPKINVQSSCDERGHVERHMIISRLLLSKADIRNFL